MSDTNLNPGGTPLAPEQPRRRRLQATASPGCLPT